MSATPTLERYAFQGFVLERAQRRVLHADGTPLALTPRHFDALLLFVEHAGELLDKETLMQALWPGLVVEENNLSQVVSALRRALGDGPQGSRFIQTVPRRGFRFIAPVLDPAVRDVLPALPPAEPPAAPAPARRRWLRQAAGVGAGTAAIAAGAAWWLWDRAPASPAPGVGASLAVLPFRPLVAEGRDELLELGMADSLIARLSTVPGLAVRSTGSVLRYAGPAQDPLRAARELDVDWIVDGSLQRQGDQLRATARLLRAADGVAAWSGSFNQKFNGVFDVQDQISARVTEALAPRLAADMRQADEGGIQARDEGGTRSTEAYQLYLAAAWRAQGSRPDSAAKAIELLQQALAIDPAYSLAWTLLAWTHRRKLWRNDAVPSEIFEAADGALQRALALTPRLAQARAGLAFRMYWYDFDWPGAEREFRSALSGNANEVSAHWGLAQLLMMQGRVDEGFTHMRQARALDPMSPNWNTMEAAFLMGRGQLGEARARLDRAFDIAPENGLAHEALGLLHLAEGKPDLGIAALRRSAALTAGSTRPRAVLATHLAGIGQRAEARAILDTLLTRAETHYVPGSSLAMVHAALGDIAPALTALERAHRERDPRVIYLKDDAAWAGLRREPRFQALMKALGLDRYGPGLMPL